jgi:hypothetical protein
MLQEVVLKVVANFPHLDIHVWYLDDGTLIGPRQMVLSALELIEEEGRSYGLHLNHSKCELYWPTSDPHGWEEFPSSIIRCSSDGVDLLGAPLGTHDYVRNFTKGRVEKINALLKAMVAMDAPQESMLLLRYCTGMPRFNYVLRTCRTDIILNEICQFDKHILHTLEHIIQGSVDVRTRDVIGLPLSRGGLGVVQASHVAWSAYVGSEADTLKLQQRILVHEQWDNNYRAALLQPLLDKWNEVHGQSEQLSLPDISNLSKVQKALTDRVHVSTITHLQSQGDADVRASTLACLHGNSSLWTDACPYVEGISDFRIPADVYRRLLGYRLHMPLMSHPFSCFKCKNHHDMFGIHVASCSGEHHDLHRAVANSLQKIAISVQQTCKTEVPHLLDDGKRPADVLIYNYSQGKDLCVDVSVVCSYTDISNASTVAGFNVSRMEESKRVKYEKQCDEKGLLFEPFVLSTQGGFGDAALALIDTLAERMATMKNISAGVAARRIKQTLQVDMLRVFGGKLKLIRNIASERAVASLNVAESFANAAGFGM